MDYENAHQLGRLILKLANTLIKNRNRHLEALDLTTSQADSLQFFLANPQCTVTDLKDALQVEIDIVKSSGADLLNAILD